MKDSNKKLNNEYSAQPITPPPPGMEAVISGISGRFPSSKNMKDLQENLFNNCDLVTDTGDRWDLDDPDIPKALGKIADISKFDATFFGIHYKLAGCMDPMGRILLETAYEAILDAGVNPKHLRGSKTGVYIGLCISETEKDWLEEKMMVNGFGMIGCSRSMQANRISYCLGVHGPSFTLDGGSSSFLVALERAYRAMYDGICDNAIVGGANLCLHPYISRQYFRLGMLSPEGYCKCFDANANGFVRSESVGAIFLQRAKNAKKIYATVVHVKTGHGGRKNQGIMYAPASEQTTFLNECYSEAGIDPNIVDYVEANGVGSIIEDAEELNAIKNVFCKNRKKSLKIGSVKSNLGNSEGASGLCSIAKVLIGMETGIIPANLHYENPREDIEAISSKIIDVVSAPTSWEGEYAGINSFAWSGVNVHVILKRNPKQKSDNATAKDNLPRLVVVSGRTKEAIETLLNDVETRPIDAEYIRLLHELYSDNIPNYLHRGYSIIGRQTNKKEPLKEITDAIITKRPVWFVFSGMGSQWPAMGQDLMQFPIFAKAIQKCDAVLRPKGLDIKNIITNKNKDAFDNILNSFVGIAAIQIGLVDLLKALDIAPDYIIGHSVGELGCAYADGCFTAEQMILCAYSRGMASIETELIFGSMAAIGLGYHDLKNMVPSDIDIACRNSTTSATISGPADSVAKFVAELQAKNIFAKEVPCSNIAYHSRYIKPAGAKLLAYLRDVIPKPIQRSEKWITSSVPQESSSAPAAKYSSAEYHTNNLLNSVLFEDVLKLIPSNAITIEIAPHGLLQAILRRALQSTVSNIALTRRGHENNAEVFLQAIGKLYLVGQHPKLYNIYPAVPFPVSRGTPMIAPFIKWEHSDDWYVTKYQKNQQEVEQETTVEFSLGAEFFEQMSGHVINGKHSLPGAGLLNLVWQTLGKLRHKCSTELPVVFENVIFHETVEIPKEDTLELTIIIHKGSGQFEVTNNNTILVSGYVRVSANIEQEKLKNPPVLNDDDALWTTEDIYKELSFREYQYTGIFRSLKSASSNRVAGKIAWSGDWVPFIDSMLQLKVLSTDTRALLIPASIKKLVIDVKEHENIVESTKDEKLIPIQLHKDINVITAGGVEMYGLVMTPMSVQKPTSGVVLEKYSFVAHRDQANISLGEAVNLCTHIALENQSSERIKVIEVFDNRSKVSPNNLVSPIIRDVLANIPQIKTAIYLGINSECLVENVLHSSIRIVDPEKLLSEDGAMIAVGYGLLSGNKNNCLKQLVNTVQNGGFLLLRDTNTADTNIGYLEKLEMHLIVDKRIGNESIILARKKEKPLKEAVVVRVNNNDFEWLGQLKRILNEGRKNGKQKSMRVIVVGEDPESGVVGLVKCLRKEPGGEIIRGVLIQDASAPQFSLQNRLYNDQLQTDLAINVLNTGRVWGSYRHMPLPHLCAKTVYNARVKQTVCGDISSLRWVQGSIRRDMNDESLTYVTHYAINSRDVMISSHQTLVDPQCPYSNENGSDIGYEYSGLTANGQRVMGLTETEGYSNLCKADRYLRWAVPNNWTMEDAATIPMSYTVCYYALYVLADIQKGETILIHAGDTDIGQAAINLALHEGCEVFTTAGTPEKRNFVKKMFPSIPNDHIGTAENTRFKEMIMIGTKGQGVHIILNLLSNEQRQVSITCLSDEGRFLEMGDLSLAKHNQIGMMCFLREICFQGAILNKQILQSVELKKELQTLLAQGLKVGAVKPLFKTVFAKQELRDAFMHMTAEKRIGKVVIKIRDEKEPLNTPIMALPSFYCDERKSYVILDGLSEIGMELANWLIQRNAKKLVLTSRTGVKSGFQRTRIQHWQSSGVKVHTVFGKDASNRNECELILKVAEDLGPVDGIFNVAVVPNNGLFTHQIVETFQESFRLKTWATKTLDEVSRVLCRELRYFVVFSTVSSGKGNTGQTNDGMANSAMERICEKRIQEGLPGLAIQWSAIDAGLVNGNQNDNEKVVIGGRLHQTVDSCLEQLDGFLMQDQPVVSSMLVAEQSVKIL